MTEQGVLTSWRRQKRDLSGHRKESTEQGALTSWRWQGEGPVRTWKGTDSARSTHVLETAEGGTCQDTEKGQPSEGHSQPGDSREGLVRTQRETDQARDTHELETAVGGTCQDTERS